MSKKKKNLEGEKKATKPVVGETQSTEESKDVIDLDGTESAKKQAKKQAKPTAVLFESMLEVGRSGYVNRTNYDDSNLNKFILQNGLHGKVVRVVADTSMEPVNGNLITKYTIYKKG